MSPVRLMLEPQFERVWLSRKILLPTPLTLNMGIFPFITSGEHITLLSH